MKLLKLPVALLAVMVLFAGPAVPRNAGIHGINGGNPSAPLTAAGGEASLLVSLPNGTSYWFYGRQALYPTAFNLTLAAASYFGISLNYTSYPNYGPEVNEFGGYWNSNSTTSFTGPYWLLWLWNSSDESWSLSNLGVGAVNTSTVSSVAWSYSLLGPNTGNPYLEPQQTPLDPMAVPSLRGGSDGSGYGAVFTDQAVQVPSDHLSWTASSGGSPIDIQPVDSNGLSYYVTDGSNGTSAVLAYNDYGMRVWHATIGSIGYQLSSPLLADGTAIISSSDGSVYALNASNGRHVFEIGHVSSSADGLTGSPVLGQEGFYLLNSSGGLDYYSFNGTLYWSAAIGGSSYYSTPALLNNTVYAFGDQAGSSVLYLLNSSSGATERIVPVNGTVYGSPSVSFGKLVFISSRKSQSGAGYGNVTVHCLSADGSRWLWNYSAGQSSGSPSSTVLTPSLVIFSSGGKLVELNSSGGKQVWNMSLGSQFSSPSPYAAHGFIAASTNSNSSSLHIISLSGSPVWSFTPEGGNDYSLSSPVFNSTTVFWADDSGHMYAFQKLDVINFSYAQHSGTVNFTSLLNSNIKGAVNFTWSIAGHTAYGRNVSYKFTGNGNYQVTVTVTYSNGTVASSSADINVNSVSPGVSGNVLGGGLVTIAEVIALPIAIIVAGSVFVMRRRRRSG